MTLAQGDTFAGYTIVRMVGAGGMGEVYLIRTKIKIIECQLCGSRHAHRITQRTLERRLSVEQSAVAEYQGLRLETMLQ
jgi:hypothetical protein